MPPTIGLPMTGSSISGPLRRALPLTLLPLSVLACGLASSPWLRAYPASVLAAPLFGAAVLSVLLPFIVVNVGVRKLWQTVLIDVVGYLFFVTLVALREPLGYHHVWSGLVHGPSQILSYALPLEQRTLLVVPVTLCWLCGAVLGECIARGWQSVLPYLTTLVTFGLSYAATQRAVTDAANGRRFDTVLAGALLLCLLLMRAIQAWVEQDSDAGPGAQGGPTDVGLPMRSVAVGTAIAVLVAGGAALAVQSDAFTGRAAAPERMPPIASSDQVSPLSFVAGLRPANAAQRGSRLFSVTVDSLASRYISIGDVDTYNGDSWSFSRTFRPSGGVVPADTDPSLRPKGQPVIQQYKITGRGLTASPWMPFQFRPQRIMGTSVDIDPASGMIVPSSALHVGQRYTVTSDVALRTFDQLPTTAQPGTSYQPVDLQLPLQVTNSLPPVISAFRHETHTPSAPAVTFLQALTADLRTHYRLVGTGRPSGGSTTPTSGSHSTRSSNHHSSRTSGHPSSGPTTGPTTRPAPPSPSASSQAAGKRPGGTSFAAVLASILNHKRTATPEQYATLVALIARQLHIPAVVTTGFRLPTRGDAPTIEPGTYTVTTGDAWTWVEIPIQGQGWVVLDPSPPPSSERKQSNPPGRTRTTAGTSAPAAGASLMTLAPSGAGHAAGAKGQPPRSHPIATGFVVTLVLAAIGALIVLSLVVAMLRKELRVRRRRGAADPRQRVVGAWQETLDVLVESGLSDPRALTSAEIADATAAAFGPEPGKQAHYLGSCANLAIFSPTTRIGAEDAEAAWGAHAALRQAVRRRLPLRQRLTSRLRYYRPRRTRALKGPVSWEAAAHVRSNARRSARRGAHRRRAH